MEKKNRRRVESSSTSIQVRLVKGIARRAKYREENAVSFGKTSMENGSREAIVVTPANANVGTRNPVPNWLACFFLSFLSIKVHVLQNGPLVLRE